MVQFPRTANESVEGLQNMPDESFSQYPLSAGDLDQSMSPSWTGSHTFALETSDITLTYDSAGANGFAEIVYSDLSSTTDMRIGSDDSKLYMYDEDATRFMLEVFKSDRRVNIRGDLHRAGTKILGARETAVASLTDNTGGTTDGSLAAVSGSGADATINNNFAELNGKIDAILTRLRNHGLIAT